MNELELKKEFDLIIPEEYFEAIKAAREAIVRAKVMEDMVNERGEAFLAKHNLEQFENEKYQISKTKDYTKKTVDTQKLKDQGLYDMFTKDTLVKGHIKVSIKYED